MPQPCFSFPARADHRTLRGRGVSDLLAQALAFCDGCAFETPRRLTRLAKSSRALTLIRGIRLQIKALEIKLSHDNRELVFSGSASA